MSASTIVVVCAAAYENGPRVASATKSTSHPSAAQKLQPYSSAVAAAPSADLQMLVHDDVHGDIGLNGYIFEIVKHSYFQRLRGVQQLGFVSLVKGPIANYKRYEHCIGTYKSALILLDALKRNSNYTLKLPLWCHQAVEIAALLHDIGHGPYSHSWERINRDFNHEENAKVAVDHIFRDVRSQELRALRDEDSGRGVQLIKALILGRREDLPFAMLGHSYIFDIVHNRRCGLDVDKWDYLRRDNRRLGVLSAEEMQFDDIFLQARIASNGQRIEYRWDDYHRIYMLYVARWRLHLQAYQLPKVVAFDKIFCDIVRNSRQQNLSNVIPGHDAWLQLNDESILLAIHDEPNSIYLHEPYLVKEVERGEHTDDYIYVQRKIDGPGEAMPADEHFAFYGNESNRIPIERQRTATEINKFFRLQKPPNDQVA